MRCPTLRELPAPPGGRRGWPWTEETPAAPGTMPGGGDWPRITIVTPSYNQAQYLEETLRSILLQGYPDLEYIVIDDGSTDESISIIRKYERWLSYWTTQANRGGPNAINQGITHMTGELFNWINSDDLLLPGALQRVAAEHAAQPEAVIAGEVVWFAGEREKVLHGRPRAINFVQLACIWLPDTSWHQPGVFFPSQALVSVGPLDETLDYAFDYDLLCRVCLRHPVVLVDEVLAWYRLHPASRTVAREGLYVPEILAISRRYWPNLPQADAAAYRKYAAAELCVAGCRRLVKRQGAALPLVLAGIREHPFWAVYAVLRFLPGWIARRLKRRIG